MIDREAINRIGITIVHLANAHKWRIHAICERFVLLLFERKQMCFSIIQLFRRQCVHSVNYKTIQMKAVDICVRMR